MDESVAIEAEAGVDCGNRFDKQHCQSLEIGEINHEMAVLALEQINTNLWLGHFDLSYKYKPTFRHTLLLRMIPSGIATDLAAGGLGRSDAPSNDVAAALELLDRADEPTLRVLAAAVARAIISVAAVADPALVLLGGPVGTHPALLPRVRAAISFPGPMRVEHGTLGTEAALHGALLDFRDAR